MNIHSIPAYNEESGKYEYVLDGNGNYTYAVRESNVEFWRNLLWESEGDFEYISHTLTHSFWGIDDNGGVFTYVNNNNELLTSDELPKGSVTGLVCVE